MKNPASAKEEKGRGSHKILSHREFSLICRSLWLIILLGIMFILSAFTFTQGKIKRTTLDNGMVVLLKENHNIPLASLFLCVPTGSARERKFLGERPALERGICTASAFSRPRSTQETRCCRCQQRNQQLERGNKEGGRENRGGKAVWFPSCSAFERRSACELA